jgi:hypothetical protein
MATGTASIKLRPIKFAFLIDPSKKEDLRQAIRINTFLWGGRFNPIIPVYKRKPAIFDGSYSKWPGYRSFINGYIDAYDPDYIVISSNKIDKKSDYGSRDVITPSELMSGVEINDGIPSYGIGLFEILRHFIEKELKYIRREPIDLSLPNYSGRYLTFLDSIFGSLPQNIQANFEREFGKIFRISKESYSILNYTELLKKKRLSLSKISSFQLKKFYSVRWGKENCIFLLDASKAIDIIDFWNLRALGWNIVPIPLQAIKEDKIKEFANENINEFYRPFRHNPEMYKSTMLLKSRSISRKDLENFTGSLNIKNPSDPGKTKYQLQLWYPRIWEEGVREIDGAGCCELEAANTKHNLNVYKDTVILKTLDPEFLNETYRGILQGCFANQIELRVSGSEDLIAEVIPEGGKKMAQESGVSIPGLRFSKRGIVYLSYTKDWSIPLVLPKAEDIYKGFLRTKEWEVRLSTPGHIAKQILKKLSVYGSVWGLSFLANKELLKLLREKMSSGKALNKNAFWGEICKIANMETVRTDPKRLLQILNDMKMFRLGIEVQCPTCRRRVWYSITNLDYEVQCTKCDEKFQIPDHSPNEMKWSYRTYGPFSVPAKDSKDHGVFSVLLTLRFFTELLHGATTPIMSFNAKKGGKEIEADLGVFFKMSKFGYSKVYNILAECKTYNKFKNNDIRKMKLLAEQFPDAILCFSTLNKSLTKKEKELLVRLVNYGRRNRIAGRPFNPVLILTGIELFSHIGPPQCWEKLGGKHEAFTKSFYARGDFQELCEVTQQLYLDVNSWHDWVEEQRKKGKKKR